MIRCLTQRKPLFRTHILPIPPAFVNPLNRAGGGSFQAILAKWLSRKSNSPPPAGTAGKLGAASGPVPVPVPFPGHAYAPALAKGAGLLPITRRVCTILPHRARPDKQRPGNGGPTA